MNNQTRDEFLQSGMQLSQLLIHGRRKTDEDIDLVLDLKLIYLVIMSMDRNR